jgi:hypothetical protein
VNSLLADRLTWDLCLDVNGNIAVASDPYSIAQDVASACRTFLGECYYDTTQGVPYFQEDLGQNPPLSVLKAGLIAAALTVPEVQSAVVYVSGVVGRNVSGQIQCVTTSGTTLIVGGPFVALTPL